MSARKPKARCSTGSAWGRGPAPSIPASCCIFSRRSDYRSRRSRRSSTLDRACSASRRQQRHARLARERRERRPTGGRLFVYRAAQEIGAFAAVLGGVDALVFTAGIGERSAEIRRRICESAAWLGIELDGGANERHGPRISAAASRVSAWVIPARGADDRAPHGVVTRTRRGARLASQGALVLTRCRKGPVLDSSQ
jgi:Acetokinase family